MTTAFIDASGASWPDEADPPPKAFSPPEPPQAQGANCNWIDDDCAQMGIAGGNGSPGVSGGDGGAGGNGGSITFLVGTINGAVRFNAAGGRGGHGVPGQEGGDGGKGGRGGNGNDCEFGRAGGSGGDGGSGGNGGNGGRGGNGGSILVKCQFDNGTNSDPLYVGGGLGGRGGQGGNGGRGGPPGDQGRTSGVFSASSDCPNPGPAPAWGQPGQPGRSGRAGDAGNAGSAQLQITG